MRGWRCWDRIFRCIFHKLIFDTLAHENPCTVRLKGGRYGIGLSVKRLLGWKKAHTFHYTISYINFNQNHNSSTCSHDWKPSIFTVLASSGIEPKRPCNKRAKPGDAFCSIPVHAHSSSWAWLNEAVTASVWCGFPGHVPRPYHHIREAEPGEVWNIAAHTCLF